MPDGSISDTSPQPSSKPGQSASERHRRAIVVVALLGALLLTPLGAMLYLDRTEANIALDEPIKIDAFVLKDEGGMSATKFDLEGSITVLLSLPSSCSDDCLALVDEAIQPVQKFIESKLTYDGLEVTPIQSWAVGESLQQANLDPFWRQFPIASKQEHLIGTSKLEHQAYLAVIDQYAEVKVMIDLSNGERLGYVNPLLSRMVMNHFMKDYLAKRTFFRREPKFEEPADSSSLQQ